MLSRSYNRSRPTSINTHAIYKLREIVRNLFPLDTVTRFLFSSRTSSSHLTMSNPSPQCKKRKTLEGDEVAQEPTLLVKKHSEKARAPMRGSALAAGYDIYRSVLLLARFFLCDSRVPL